MNISIAFAGLRARFTERTWWTVAWLASLSVHVGAAAWLMREPAIMPADSSPPAAIMIEVAAVPEATLTDELEISPDQVVSEESTPAEEVKAPEEPPVEEEIKEVVEETVTEPQPVVVEDPPEEPKPVEEEQPKEPEEELKEEELPEQPSAVTVTPRPAPRAIRTEKRKEREKRAVRQRQKPRIQSRQRRRAQAPVQRSTRNAAQRSASGFSRNVSRAGWRARLMAHLERRKRYPSDARRRRQQGTAYVRFRIDGSGRVTSVRLVRSSGHAALDRAVVSLVRRASPVPAPPPGVNRTITAPVRYRLR